MTLTSGVLLAAGAVAALVLLPPMPAPPRRRRPRPEAPPRPRGLSATERQLGLARASAGDVHDRLTPLLRDVARDRLATAGIDLDRNPEVAAEALGPETWELVRPDRPAPADRHGPGATLAELRAAVSALERIARAG
ncbi:MAG TPA: hypothetical protein VFI18_03815 [Gaiellales bacterium]|nr:hypothetical protein [Gaiellales bacterium]